MEPLSWTGSFGVFFDPIFGLAVLVTAFFTVASITLSFARPTVQLAAGETATLNRPRLSLVGWVIGSLLFGVLVVIAMILSAPDTFAWAMNYTFALVENLIGDSSDMVLIVSRILLLAAVGLAIVVIIQFLTEGFVANILKLSGLSVLALVVLFGLLGIVLPFQTMGIVGAMFSQFAPVWLALIILFAASIAFKRRLGLYGKLFDSPIGMVGFGLVMFWIFTGVFGQLDLIVTHDSLSQVSGMKNKIPGTPLAGAEEGEYAYYLLGGDNLARDVFSRMIDGAWVVVQIAPLATLFAFMVGITLGLPAGYFGGRLDTVISFMANLILAFPVILLFYLLVTPEIVLTGVPNFMAVVLFIFPILFAGVLINSRYHTQPKFRTPLMIGVLGVMFWIYLSLISTGGYLVENKDIAIPALPEILDLFDVSGGILVVFVSVVFVNSPTVFRIVRGLAMDIKTRDYVAAAQTRGESAWYIMLWEILPNARGPLIVDFCLRIGYTTILLGTLGFFGLGLPPESPDWGSTINEGRKLLSIYLHPALPPALALLSLVLGLNLLADGLREESLKD